MHDLRYLGLFIGIDLGSGGQAEIDIVALPYRERKRID
jgi:hypothetical protein